MNSSSSPDPHARYRYSTALWAAGVGLCAAVIFYLSTKGFNLEWSLKLLDSAIRLFGLALSPHDLFQMDRIVRKLAHVAEYAVLAPVLYRTLHPSTKTGWHTRSGLFSILGGALYAASDEIHQLYVPDRRGSVSDWCIDMAGVILGISVVYLWARLFPQDNKRSAATNDNPEAK